VRSLLRLALQAALLCAIVAAFFIRTPQVSGFSMEPQIASGEYVLIDTLTYHFRAPERGDIVAFHHGDPGDDGGVFIKRVIGLPGDTVQILHGVVYVDGRKLEEPYVVFHDSRSYSQIRVPPGSVYVLGDNRADSEDSRIFGCVHETAIIGRAISGLWPPQSVRAL
jgi:signal peptidase I